MMGSEEHDEVRTEGRDELVTGKRRNDCRMRWVTGRNCRTKRWFFCVIPAQTGLDPV